MNITPASLPMPLDALLKPCVFGGRLPRAVIHARLTVWAFYTTSEKELDKTQQRLSFGTGRLPRRAWLLLSSTLR